VITSGYLLPAQAVLHTVGPRNQSAQHLQSCYETTLSLAAQYGLRSIALCCVSTGIFGFPLDDATHTALQTVRQWLDRNPGVLHRVVFVVYLECENEMYQKILPSYFEKATIQSSDKSQAGA